MLKFRYAYRQGNKSLRVYKEEKLAAFYYQSQGAYKESEILIPLDLEEIQEIMKMLHFFGVSSTIR